ncbi:Sensor histidine kinase BtsS [bioreactor metagenome]|uniref:Sensor histidine kinase BtsS n=1 Tax=bioreactor metagenome TaxID=1076179 RepID=A0A644ZK35_9ZZZZ
MVIILLLARPFNQAVELVKIISLPMVVINSVGTALFISVFDSVFIEQDKEAAGHVRLVLGIADRCLPFLRHGLYSKSDVEAAVHIILDESWVSGAALTDAAAVLSASGLVPSCAARLPEVCRRTIETGSIQTAERSDPDDPLSEVLRTHSAVCAPLTQKDGEVVGTLLVLVRKFRLTHEVEYVFVGGLAKLFSTQLELAQVDNQKKLLQKAEFAALQSQINPHFLFNALSTITSFCREKPDRARELLIVLSTYFRNTLQTGEYMISLRQELEHVKAYLELEKARFEDKLTVEFELPEEALERTVPSFILQPIVENAVKHGAMGSGNVGRVIICAHNTLRGTEIAVTDNGTGIPPEMVERLHSDLSMTPGSVGMINVNKRLKSIYGVDNGLIIQNVPAGTRISMVIPYAAGQRLEGEAS